MENKCCKEEQRESTKSTNRKREQGFISLKRKILQRPSGEKPPSSSLDARLTQNETKDDSQSSYISDEHQDPVRRERNVKIGNNSLHDERRPPPRPYLRKSALQHWDQAKRKDEEDDKYSADDYHVQMKVGYHHPMLIPLPEDIRSFRGSNHDPTDYIDDEISYEPASPHFSRVKMSTGYHVQTKVRYHHPMLIRLSGGSNHDPTDYYIDDEIPDEPPSPLVMQPHYPPAPPPPMADT